MSSAKKAAKAAKIEEKPKRKYVRRVATNGAPIRVIKRWSVAELETENTRLEQKIRTLEGVILLIHRAGH